jgi:transcriptional regulator with PAS, ATPase and Fis domain
VFQSKSEEESVLDSWQDWQPGMSLSKKAFLVLAGKKRLAGIVGVRKYVAGVGGPQLVMCFTEWPGTGEQPEKSTGNGAEREQFHNIVGKTPQMRKIYSLIEMAANSSANVIIEGESGTGKELVASAIHNCSDRRERPFVRINCAAISETLLESELFGHVKGAFTGAYQDRAGTFESAHQGTILLDEIAEISAAMQVKMLRVLQERLITRVGDNREIPIDVRIIAASNRSLRKLVSRGKFREDLFYRLNVFPIQIPPLSERKADIVLLCNHFIEKYSRRTGKKIASVSPEAMHILLNYCWPGNVRELENAIEHAFVLCRRNEIQLPDLPNDLREAALREGICMEKQSSVAPGPVVQALSQPIRARGGRLNISREQLMAEIKKHGGNKAATARTLGISSVGLWKKMKKMGLD